MWISKRIVMQVSGLRALDEIWNQNSKSLSILWESPSIYSSPLQCQSPKETPTKYLKTIQRKQPPHSPASWTLLHLSWWPWDLQCVSQYTLLLSQPCPQMFVIMSHLSGPIKELFFFSFITTKVQQLKNILTTLEPLLSLVMIIECLYPGYTVCSIIKLCISVFGLGNITGSILKVGKTSTFCFWWCIHSFSLFAWIF